MDNRLLVVAIICAGLLMMVVWDEIRRRRRERDKPFSVSGLRDEVQGHACMVIKASLEDEPDEWKVWEDKSSIVGPWWRAKNEKAGVTIVGVHSPYALSVKTDGDKFTPPMIWRERLADAVKPYIDAVRLEREVVRLEQVVERFNRREA